MTLPDYPATASCDMAHGVSKKARDYGCVVERTPHYSPEVKTIEMVWNSAKTAYSARYDNAFSVPDLVRSLFGDFAADQLLSNVRHADASTRAVASP